MTSEQRRGRLEGRTFRTALWRGGALLLLVASWPCFAEDDPQQELDRLRKELEKVRGDFEAYKSARDTEIDRLNRTVAEQAERTVAAIARAREAETELDNLRARLDLARRRNHELQETAATLAEEVKQANAVNAENRASLERMSENMRAFLAAKQLFATVKQELATDFLVRRYLPNAIENYQRQFKRLPPMSVKELKITSRFSRLRIDTNASNECSEALLVALRNPDFPAPLRARYLPTRDPVGNTDADLWNLVPDGSSKFDALEIVDAWGHPVVYIHKNQYKEAVRIINGKGAEVQVVALWGPDGVFYNPTSYQIISLGPNGVQEIKTKDLKDSDDIRNFELKSK
ncbi:MAG: hypothetical protein ACYS0K_18000 [Planctomycetota bacterium]|jgi:hypothetical protein